MVFHVCNGVRQRPRISSRERFRVCRDMGFVLLLSLAFIGSTLAQGTNTYGSDDLASQYYWRPVTIGGGGFITGGVVNLSDSNVYA